MNYTIHIVIASLSACLAGLFLFAYFNGFIIFRYPISLQKQNSVIIMSKKQVILHYWHHNRWNSEKIELLWSDDVAHNLHSLINNWLILLDEEQIIHKKATLQSVLLSADKKNAYLSFDRNPLDKEQSTYEKWLLLEGLLKTVRENSSNIQTVTFLVHHQPLIDTHLDFTNPWPITGFLH